MPAQPSGLAFRYGIAIQTAEGSAAAQPTYDIPMHAGGVEPQQTVNDFEVSSANFVRPGRFKSDERWGTNGLQVGAFVDSIGAIFTALLGDDDKTGSAPTVHTITAVSPNPIWVSMFEQVPAPTGGAVTNFRYKDGKVSAVQINWAAGMPLKVTVEAVGKNFDIDTPATWTPTTTNVYQTPGPWLGSVSLTSKLDIAATPATTTITTLTEGSIRIERPVVAEATTAITPEYFSQGLMNAAFSATQEFVSMAAVRSTYTGSSSGTTASALLVNGSLDFKFEENPTASSNNLQIQMPATQFEVTLPSLDTGGGPLHLPLSGTMVLPSSGQPVTVIVRNAVTTAYDA